MPFPLLIQPGDEASAPLSAHLRPVPRKLTFVESSSARREGGVYPLQRLQAKVGAREADLSLPY